jgi:hypothetical protein
VYLSSPQESPQKYHSQLAVDLAKEESEVVRDEESADGKTRRVREWGMVAQVILSGRSALLRRDGSYF